MKPGQASRTAELVCMGRAMAHGRSDVVRYSDPVALALLSSEAKASVAAALSNTKPKRLRDGVFYGYLRKQSDVMVARTVAIDDVVREAKHPQVVILGAGLDGRAWRMPELKDAVVFEVDHPDTQQTKRARVAGLEPSAKEIRFVPVDFTKDSLADALTAAGHDPSVPTTWIWEGVVMYLAVEEIEATLAVVRARSAAESALVVVYHRPAPFLFIVRRVVARVGEPLKSSFEPEAMRSLLARYGFRVRWDKDIGEIGAELSPRLGRLRRAVRHLRIVAAISSSA